MGAHLHLQVQAPPHTAHAGSIHVPSIVIAAAVVNFPTVAAWPAGSKLEQDCYVRRMGVYPMIFIVLGPDRLLAKTAVNKLVAQHDPVGQNTSRFDADSDPLSMVMNGVATPSFFGGARVIVATGYLASGRPSPSRTASKSKGSRSSKSQVVMEGLEGILATAAGNPVLILHEPELAAIPSTFKPMLPDSITVSAHQPQRGLQLVDLTIASFRKRNCSIDRDSATYFLDRLFSAGWRQAASNPAFDHPPDIETLVNEIEKLSIAAGSDEITEELIDELTPQTTAERTFPLLDAVVTGQVTSALRELTTVPAGEQQRTRTLAQVFQQVEYAAAASQAGRPSDPLQAGKELGMSNPNRMKPVLRSVAESRIPIDQLLTAAVDADRRLKSGMDPEPDDALYNLILHPAADRSG
ncbi:hypothetical protein BH24CHL4_BH24CHL4_05120 [soil metagenome]